MKFYNNYNINKLGKATPAKLRAYIGATDTVRLEDDNNGEPILMVAFTKGSVNVEIKDGQIAFVDAQTNQAILGKTYKPHQVFDATGSVYSPEVEALKEQLEKLFAHTPKLRKNGNAA